MKMTERFFFCLFAHIAVTFFCCPDSKAESLLSSVQVSVEDGLPHTDVSAITQDTKGYIWIGTYSGVCRYDGVSIVSYDQVNSGLEGSRVTALLCTSSGLLFIGTETAGISVLDTRTGSFLKPVNVPMNYVNTITEGPDGQVWIGTKDGVSRISYDFDGYDISSWSLGSNVFGIGFGEDSSLILTRDDGVFFFDPSSGTSTELKSGIFCTSILCSSETEKFFVTSSKGTWFRKDDGKLYLVDKRPSKASFSDSGSQVWICTDSDMMLKFDWEGTLAAEYKVMVAGNPPGQEINLSSVFLDRSSVMWLGTYGHGFLRCGVKSHIFNYYIAGDNPDEKMISSDSNGRFWISSRDGSLYSKHSDGRIIKVDGGSLDLFNGAVISSLYEDSVGNIWLGTWTQGLARVVASEVEKMAVGSRFRAERQVLVGRSVYQFAEDGRGFMWVSTGNGVVRYNLATDTVQDIFVYDRHNVHSLIDNFTTDLLITDLEDGFVVWAGSRLGITRFLCREDGSVRDILRTGRGHSEDDLVGEFVAVLLQDSKGRVWVSTLGGGLNKLICGADEQDLKFEHFNVSNCAFPNNELESIVEGEDGSLWIGGNGIMRFNPETSEVRRFTKEDGLQSDVFKIWSAAKLPDGTMAFGGINGFNVFKPEELKVTGSCPPVYITGITVNNVPLEDISSASLSHKQNNISFSFAALDYENPLSNVYRYMLSGADKQWHYCDGTSAQASYLNLDPGRYTFTVYGAENGGEWSIEPAKIIFRIKPPLLSSIPAFLLYSLLLASGLVIVIRTRRKRSESERKLELEHQLRLEEEQRNSNELKLHTDFLHEIKTPLTLITTPVEEMLENQNLGKSTLARLKLVSQSTKILGKYIEELTDLRQMDNGRLSIKVSRSDFGHYVKTIASMFQPVADSRNITLDLSGISSEPLPLTFDNDQMTKVIINLMSNAIKFSPDTGGLVKVGVLQEGDRAVLSVSNVGVGIFPDELDKIFDRFHQGRNNDRGGMGIGLAISKHIVQMHGGEICAESIPGGETLFKVSIPLGDSHFSEEDFKKENSDDTTLTDIEPAVDYKNCGNVSQFSTVDREHTVLIVDDNESLRNYLAMLLSSRYNVIVAENGQQGYERAIADQPDVIISDILMPKMNGVELCARIKENEDTSHIPVILLTARVLPVHKIEGYQSLADDYITKPFNSDVLLSRISGLITLREKMREHLRTNVSLNPSEITATPADEKFIKKCISFVEDHISDPDYGVEELCLDMGMSRPTIYRKIKAISGESAVTFVRNIRIKRAAQLLETGSYESVNEVMTAVGFSNSAYFAKKFEQAFGTLPKDYSKEKH